MKETEKLPAHTGTGTERAAGHSFWTALLLPALAGTVLPFWLKPPGFAFKWLEAGGFLLATGLFHAGFALWHLCLRNKRTGHTLKTRFCFPAFLCFLGMSGLGVALHTRMEPGDGVYPYIFAVYGFAAVFTGLLYVAPPFTFYQRPGGEVVASAGSVMIPVLGAYLMQAGDLTRTVYLACMPVVAAMGLWVWISRLISLPDDEKNGRSSLVMLFPFRFSGRIVPLLLCILIYATLGLAIWGRPALNPVALTALLSGPLAFQIIRILWHDPMDRSQLYMARKYAYYVHMIVCLAIIGSSLVPV